MPYDYTPAMLRFGKNGQTQDYYGRPLNTQIQQIPNYQPGSGGAQLQPLAAGLHTPGLQGGLINNYGAGLAYNATGQMPRQTVGGLAGIGNPYAGRQPGYAPYSGFGGGGGSVQQPGYAPMHQAPLEMAPQTQAGYRQQMGLQNPGGRFFGGALPAYGTSPNGGVRPMWMGPPAAPQGLQKYAVPDSRFIGGLRAYTDGSNLSAISPGDAQYTKMQAAQAMFDARRGGLAARQQDYQQRTQADMQARGLGVAQNAYNKSQARKTRLGIGDPLDMAMRENPGIAGEYGLAQLGLQGQMAQQGLAYTALAQKAQQQHLQNLTGLAGHIAGMDIPPGLKQQYMSQIMGAYGLQMPPGGSQPGTGLAGQSRVNFFVPHEVQSQLMGAKTPQEKEQILNQSGITDIGTRHQVLGAQSAHLTPQPPSLFDTAAQGAITMATGGNAPVLNQDPRTFTPWQRWAFGLPEIVGGKKPPQRYPQRRGL